MSKSDLTAVHDRTGKPIKAQFLVEASDDEVSVVIESRGGSIGAPNERNAQYNLGVDLILARLGERRCILNDAVVDTRATEKLGLSRTERRLLSGEFPIDLADYRPANLRSALCAAQRPIGRAPDAKGSGNNTKRMRLYVSGLPEDVQVAAVALATDAVSTESDEDLISVTRPLRRGRKQGRGLTSEERRAVELRAMAVVRRHLEKTWGQVEDVSANHSCDFICYSDDCELFVEVKGTTGAGESVIVTRNEVALARAKSPNTLLAVVSAIQLDKAVSPPIASAGELIVVHPWRIDDDDLDPLAFDYQVPCNDS